MKNTSIAYDEVYLQPRWQVLQTELNLDSANKLTELLLLDCTLSTNNGPPLLQNLAEWCMLIPQPESK